MKDKWKVYVMTLITYAVVHSGRTTWATIKIFLVSPPYLFTPTFLGAVDLTFLFSLAIAMNLLGSKSETLGPKRFLIYGLIGLIISSIVIGFLLLFQNNQEWLYLILYGIVFGVVSSVAWPVCLYMISRHFDSKSGIALSAWNGCSQLGDVISLVTYSILVNEESFQPFILFFLYAIYLIFLGVGWRLVPVKILNLPFPLPTPPPPLPPPPVELKESKVETADGQINMMASMDEGSSGEKNSQKQIQMNQNSDRKFMQGNVSEQSASVMSWWRLWLIPGVALNVLAFSFIKSVNSIIVSWMLFYLIQIQLQDQAAFITILWLGSVFCGGILCAIVNTNFNKIIFVGELIISCILFVFLKEFTVQIDNIAICITIVICGIFYGGPYNLFSTGLPIALGNRKDVMNIFGAKSMIIALMEGFGLFVCGISLIFVPAVGVLKIHVVASALCGLAAATLICEIIREKFAERKSLLLKQLNPVKE